LEKKGGLAPIGKLHAPGREHKGGTFREIIEAEKLQEKEGGLVFEKEKPETGLLGTRGVR